MNNYYSSFHLIHSTTQLRKAGVIFSIIYKENISIKGVNLKNFQSDPKSMLKEKELSCFALEIHF